MYQGDRLLNGVETRIKSNGVLLTNQVIRGHLSMKSTYLYHIYLDHTYSSVDEHL